MRRSARSRDKSAGCGYTSISALSGLSTLQVARLYPSRVHPSLIAVPTGPGLIADGECVPQPCAPNLLDSALSEVRRPVIGVLASGISTATTATRSPLSNRSEAFNKDTGSFELAHGSDRSAFRRNAR